MSSPPPPDSYLIDLQARGLLPPAQAATIAAADQARPFSLHYEIRALLYLGITLLAGDWACSFISILTALATE